MTHPDRVLARLVFSGLVAAGALVLGSWLLAIVGSRRAVGGTSFWCVIAPASSLDVAVHVAALGLWLACGLVLVSAIRAVNWQRALTAELRGAAKMASASSASPVLRQAAARAGVADLIDLIDATDAFGFVYGWANPRICLSTGMAARLTEPELEAVLHHEHWHARRRDPVRLLLAHTVAAAFRPLPAFQRLADEYALAMEIAADRHVVTVMGGRRWLASALAKMLTDGAAVVAAPAFTVQADARIAALAGEPVPDSHGIGRLTLASIGVQVLLIIVIVQGTPFPPILSLHPMC